MCLPLHLLRDFLQVINELLLVLVDLAALLGDDSRVDVEGLLEGDGDEFLVGKHGLAGEEGRADAALDEVLIVWRYGEKWMMRGLQLCAA